LDKLIALMIVVAFMIAMAGAAILAIRWKRKSSQRAALLGLGLELLGAGMNPLPPAQVQIEEVTRRTKVKKDSETGEPE
jgi:uncharacterized membrane protein YedE/YeeE